MDYHGINCKGKFWVHRVTDITLNPHSGTSTDEGRMVYDQTTGQLYFGGPTSWHKVIIDPITDNTTTVGTSATRFANIHSVIFSGTATAARYS